MITFLACLGLVVAVAPAVAVVCVFIWFVAASIREACRR